MARNIFNNWKIYYPLQSGTHEPVVRRLTRLIGVCKQWRTDAGRRYAIPLSGMCARRARASALHYIRIEIHTQKVLVTVWILQYCHRVDFRPVLLLCALQGSAKLLCALSKFTDIAGLMLHAITHFLYGKLLERRESCGPNHT